MPDLGRATFLLGFLLFVVALSAQAQSPPKESKATGSASGRVTVDGKPKSGIEIWAQPERQSSSRSVRATADEDGRFLLTGLAPGRYKISPWPRTYVSAGRAMFARGPIDKVLVLAEGEAVEGIDFALEPGGIITGRVTDAEGRPVGGEFVTLIQIIETERDGIRRDSWTFNTNKSGVYRVSALPAGRYILSAGGPPYIHTRMRPDDGRLAYPRTFHPDVADVAEAKVIELAAGTEAANVDIKLGPPIRHYAVTGRLIDAETGRAVPNGLFALDSLGEGSARKATQTSHMSDDKGEFRIEGLMPGRYAAFANVHDQSEFYSEPVIIVVSEEDVSGVELKLLRGGASVSGRVVIEGISDPATVKLPQLGMRVSPSAPGPYLQTHSASARFGADGAFLIGGLPPGQALFYLVGESDLKGFTLLRVERGGVEQPDGIALAPNEQVTDARVVIAYRYGAEIVRGQVKVEGGTLPIDAYIMIDSLRIGPDGQYSGPSAIVDSRGHFTLEGVTAGDYELTLTVYAQSIGPLTRRYTPAKHLVKVAKGKENNVVLTLNLAAPYER
jgi:protocatechuate 3,4-dioxygenase beta subunit